MGRSESLKKWWSNLGAGEKELVLSKSLTRPDVVEKRRAASITDRANKMRSDSLKRYRSNLSEQERLEVSASRSKGVSRYLASLGRVDRQKRSLKARRGVKRYYSRIDPLLKAEVNRKRSVSLKRLWAELTPNKKTEWLKKWLHNEQVYEVKRKLWASLSEDEKNRITNRVMRANRIIPSKPEIWLSTYLEEFFPNMWVYNGNREQGIVIGGKVPDFVRRDKEKQILELFGNYWHDPADEEKRIQFYRERGFECLVLWESECCSQNSFLRTRILKMVGRKVLV